MKITHLITSLEGGGTENFLSQLVRDAPKTWQPSVLFLKKDGVIGDRLRAMNIQPRHVNAFTLFQLLEREKPDVLHTLLYRAHQIGRVVGRAARVKQIVSSQRAIDAWQKPWHKALDRWTLRCCNHVVVNSSAAEALIRKRAENRSDLRITKLPNGVDLTRFTPQDRARARALFHLPADAVIGGSLLRLHEEKGADFLVPFAQDALTKHPQLHLVIGGAGPLEQTLRRQTKDQSWASRIHWLGWTENTPAFYAALDFFFSLSREESFPQSLLEASVMGIPWIAPDIGGVSDFIAAGAPGMVYPVGSIKEAAAQIPQFMDGLLRKVQTLEDFRRTFNVQNMVKRFYDILSF